MAVDEVEERWQRGQRGGGTKKGWGSMLGRDGSYLSNAGALVKVMAKALGWSEAAHPSSIKEVWSDSVQHAAFKHNPSRNSLDWNNVKSG